jgi:hypothetical protein
VADHEQLRVVEGVSRRRRNTARSGGHRRRPCTVDDRQIRSDQRVGGRRAGVVPCGTELGIDPRDRRGGTRPVSPSPCR